MNLIHIKAARRWLSLPVVIRFVIASVIGGAAAYGVGHWLSWEYTPLVFWDVTVLIISLGLWIAIRSMSATETKAHATKDDPGRGTVSAILLLASFASLAGVLVLLIDTHNANGLFEALDIVLGIGSVIASWVLIHLLHTLRYADLYFKGGKAIDFHDSEEPTYQDFAYVAFTIGMTYQVSDTDFTTREIRTAARQHAVISYVFGTAIIATVINTLASLGGK
ncbi:MAG TPA: DUF1345 domain-containing protein [Candidatus Paceibacterota bacterium]|nr:DUF1345 domain-containing protein [Candidatus Paceibacterota bacterium]